MGQKDDSEALAHQARALERMHKLAWLLDASIVVPFTGYRIGIDALIGLIPGAGDAAGAVLSAVIFLQARKLGVPWRTQMRMLGNILIELVVGAVPVVGDIFDMGFKANLRNVRLAMQAVESAAEAPRRSRLQRWADVATPFLAIVAVILAVLALATFLYSLAGGPGV